MTKVRLNTPKKIILTTPVWGESYVQVYLKHVLPNVFDASNIKFFEGDFEFEYLIYTGEDDTRFFEQNDVFASSKQVMRIELLSVEPLRTDNKYDLLTACYNDSIERARTSSAALIFLNADMIYSAGSFRSLEQLIIQGKRAVEIEGFRVQREGFVENLPAAIGSSALPAREMVRLALKHKHRISASHIWEPQGSDGYMPFHTYWLVGSSGMLAKASHIYPLYLFPRTSHAGAAKTIDWDLVDTAGLPKDERHIVTNSDEIFSVELSPKDYWIQPTFPFGANVADMQSFIAKNCTPEHRERLRTSIRFIVRDRTLSWLVADLKSRLWFDAVAGGDKAAERALDALAFPAKVARLLTSLVQRISDDTQIALARQGIGKRVPFSVVGRCFARRTGRRAESYLAMIEARPGKLETSFRAVVENDDVSGALETLDRYYREIALSTDSPAGPPRTTTHLTGKEVLRLDWAAESNLRSPYALLGPKGRGSVFLRVPDEPVRILMRIAQIDASVLDKIFIIAGGQKLHTLRIEQKGQALQAALPGVASRVAEARGILAIEVVAPNYNGERAAFDTLELETISEEQAAFLGKGFDPSYVDLESARLPPSGPPSVAPMTCSEGAAETISVGREGLAGIPLSTILPGRGWGPPGRWGTQTFRWVSAEREAEIRLGGSWRPPYFELTLYTCPPEWLEAAVAEVDGRRIPCQLRWADDHFRYRVDLKEIGISPAGAPVSVRLIWPESGYPQRLAFGEIYAPSETASLDDARERQAVG